MKAFLRPSLLILPFFVFIFITGCNDENADEDNAQNAREETIERLAGTEGKSWILLSATSGMFDITQMLPACEMDNLYVLYPTGEGEYRSGEEKCEEDDPDVLETGEWELSEDLETLTLTIGLINEESQILEVTDDRLRLQFTYDGQVVIGTFGSAD